MSKLFFVTDAEATGPAFHLHNMYQLATVPVLANGTILPGISFNLAFSTAEHDPVRLEFLKREVGFTPKAWEERTDLVQPAVAMKELEAFVEATMKDHRIDQVRFMSDNLAFDWGFVHTYFCRYGHTNPFGHSGLNIPCLSLGFYGNRNAWKQFRSETHTHDALEDTRGNAGAFVKMIQDGLKVS